jgi:hypothetical protein
LLATYNRQVTEQKNKLEQITTKDLADFNANLKRKRMPYVGVTAPGK